MYPTKASYPEHVENSQNSAIKKTSKPIEKWVTDSDTWPEKTHGWQRSTRLHHTYNITQPLKLCLQKGFNLGKMQWWNVKWKKNGRISKYSVSLTIHFLKPFLKGGPIVKLYPSDSRGCLGGILFFVFFVCFFKMSHAFQIFCNKPTQLVQSPHRK